MNPKNLSVVTGAASGIGAACVRHLVARGDTVVALDLPGTWSEADTHQTGVAAFYPCDVLQESMVREVEALVFQNHGAVSGLVSHIGSRAFRMSSRLIASTGTSPKCG